MVVYCIANVTPVVKFDTIRDVAAEAEADVIAAAEAEADAVSWVSRIRG